MRIKPLLTSLACAAALLAARPAAAHISLEQGGTHLSRYGDSYLKEGPCGKAGGTRGTNIYTYAPGATITISLVETIPHPSYFRWAFQQSGDDEFKEPASIKPIDPNRPCPIDSGDHCGASDYYNTPNVLPGMDDLNPHLANGVQKYTWQLTLPNVECDNCTLQVIQVMEDNLAHGDYDPTPGVGIEDIYHQCIDLVLKNGAPSSNVDGGTGGTGGTGGIGGGGSAGAGGGGGGGGSGVMGSKSGCAFAGRFASGGTPAPFALLLVAGFAVATRRRRAR
ncbi:MAG TPA: SCE4755 family polysaccharide monooxygenase-like protein [Polyangia bacterium]|nr:SCE4755 family polysaccharide monooxygenase-like protein [Polyangia bacterium]